MSQFKTVTLQGAQLTNNQRAQLQQRANVMRMMPKIDLVSDALNNLQAHKESGGKAEKTWRLDFAADGTPYLGDTFLF